MSSNNSFPQPICEQIWNDKYRLITPNPEIQDDMSIQDTWRRIAKACANSVPDLYGTDANFSLSFNDMQARKELFYEALEDFKFLPAGRITSGAGSGRNVTLFNCYVMGTIPDSMGGIFDNLKEAALTMQQGGGIGYDFSTLRPKGAPVKGVDADASGPLTFMDVWDAMCRTVMSAGSRRGAMMATMRCDHPDIEDFIKAKRDPLRFRMFNMSVLITDPFMNAVDNDADWNLEFTNHHGERRVYKTIRARELWSSIMKNTYDYAEPGVIFIDRINKQNNLWYCEKISATNPCGEQPLPPYGACLLGSLNMTKFVKNPFTDKPTIDQDGLKKTIKAAVRMLDSIIDISLFPIPEQKAEAKAKRRMGIGITGLADMLFMMNIVYGSEDAVILVDELMKHLAIWAYEESIQLAKEFGPCPVTKTLENRQKFIQSGFMRNMPRHITDGIIFHGIRNSLLMSIAPTGTISLYAGNLSSGIEPIFAPRYTRKVLNPDGTKREEQVEDYGVKLYREYLESKGYDTNPNPAFLVTAQDLPPSDHVKMQAAAQKWVDSSISKTINCPADIPFVDFVNVYMEAWKSGCKGCTTYRPNDVTGSVLSVEPEKENVTEDYNGLAIGQTKEPFHYETSEVKAARSKVLCGHTYKLKWSDHNFYVTINNDFDSKGNLKLYEIFINSQDMSNFQWITALTRMMSSVFRRNDDIQFVIEDLKAIMDPNGGSWVDGKYIPSFIALLGSTVESHLQALKDSDEVASWYVEENTKELITHSPKRPDLCPKCHSSNFHKAEGCMTCGDCGHSKCG